MKIDEAASAAAINIETVRYYEKMGLLPPPGPGRRQLPQLRQGASGARNLGFTLDQVRELLGLADDRAQSCAAVDTIATAHLSEIDRKLAD